MARKVCDYIKRNKVNPTDIGDDIAAFVALATSNRRQAPTSEGVGGASSNPFGGFQVRSKPEGSAIAQGGIGRQKAPRPRFAATQFAAMPTTAFMPPAQSQPESPKKETEVDVPDQSVSENHVQPQQEEVSSSIEPVSNAASLFGGVGGGDLTPQSESGDQTQQYYPEMQPKET